MGQKVNPINFRLQVHKNWSSRWFTANKKEFAEAIRQDHEIRELIEKKFASRPTINRIEIERSANLITPHQLPPRNQNDRTKHHECRCQRYPHRGGWSFERC